MPGKEADWRSLSKNSLGLLRGNR